MGRPGKNPTFPVPVRLTQDELEFVDQLAEEIGASRSRVLANLLSSGIEDARMLRAVGILPTAIKLMEVKDRLKQLMSNYMAGLQVKAN